MRSKSILKKILSLVCVVTLAFSFASCKEDDEKKIDILKCKTLTNACSVDSEQMLKNIKEKYNTTTMNKYINIVQNTFSNVISSYTVIEQMTNSEAEGIEITNANNNLHIVQELTTIDLKINEDCTRLSYEINNTKEFLLLEIIEIAEEKYFYNIATRDHSEIFYTNIQIYVFGSTGKIGTDNASITYNRIYTNTELSEENYPNLENLYSTN